MLPPDWESGWNLLESHSATACYQELPHPLGEVPVKVTVLIRALTGVNAGLVFEAYGAGSFSDDDVDNTYCGVVYNYNELAVRVYAPTAGNTNNDSYAFCTGTAAKNKVSNKIKYLHMSNICNNIKYITFTSLGGSSWGNGYSSQADHQAEVKAKAWLLSSMRPPCWISQPVLTGRYQQLVILQHFTT